MFLLYDTGESLGTKEYFNNTTGQKPFVLVPTNIISHVNKCIHFFTYGSCNLRSNEPGGATQSAQPAQSKVGAK